MIYTQQEFDKGTMKRMKEEARRERPRPRDEALARFREQAVRATVSKATSQGYGKIVLQLREEGATTYEGYLAYIKRRWGRREKGKISARTLRSYKSALLHEEKAKGTANLTQAESADLDVVLSGLEAKEGERQVRGAIDEEKLWECVQAAHREQRPEIADGYVVAHGCILRPRDIGEMLVSRVDLERNIVWVRSKQRVTKHGDAYEAHEIGTRSAREVLKRRVQNTQRNVFEGWTAQKASAIIKKVAKDNKWNTDWVVYDGMHTLRHGGAVQKRRIVEEEVRQAGGWKTMTTARWYGRERGRNNSE